MKIISIMMLLILVGCGKTVIKIPADAYNHMETLKKKCSENKNDITETYANLIEHYTFNGSRYGWKHELVVECRDDSGVKKTVKKVIMFGSTDDYKTRWW